MPLTLPAAARSALLLDLDGTLLELAPTPDQVVVPAGLPHVLRRLRTALGGALAIITGRPIAQIDALLTDAPYAVAGEHGGAIRHAPDAAVRRAKLPDPPASWRAAAAELVARHPGALLELKQRGLVLHYRLAPEHGPALQAAALAMVAPEAERFQVLEAAMAWEIRPRGVDKGVALGAVVAEPPFAGKLPVFIGDDVTDEDAIRAARALGGAGMRVDAAFGTPQRVRDWLASSADALEAGRDWPAPPGPA